VTVENRQRGFEDVENLRHHQWDEQALENGFAIRDERWSEAIAVGSVAVVESVKNHLGVKVSHREVIEADAGYALR
jgi:phosphotransacetylase